MTIPELLEILEKFNQEDIELTYSTGVTMDAFIRCLQREVRLEEMIQGKSEQSIKFCKENHIPYSIIKTTRK